jgi:hypothetical protein
MLLKMSFYDLTKQKIWHVEFHILDNDTFFFKLLSDKFYERYCSMIRPIADLKYYHKEYFTGNLNHLLEVGHESFVVKA